MAAVHPALLSLLLVALMFTSYQYSSRNQATSSWSVDGGGRNMTVYAMAVGQGDGNIILCPNGRDVLIVDMGSTYLFANNSYGAYLLKEKFKVVKNQKNIHIVITHPHEDHYNFLLTSLDKELLPLVHEIVVGGWKYTNKSRFRNVINKMRKSGVPVYTVNSRSECFGNSDCRWTPVSAAAVNNHVFRKKSPAVGDPWQFCGREVSVTVLGANICGRKCRRQDENGQSVILKLAYKGWSLFLSGDFEGEEQQLKLMKRWPQSILHSTYYKVAHHGSEQANLPDLLTKIRPRRAYVSQAHPVATFCKGYKHPRCQVIDKLIELVNIDSNPRNSPIVCWTDERGIEQRSGYAIYETCREYDTDLDKQICHDIMITTDGYNDHTTYVGVPREYLYIREHFQPSRKCRKPLEDLKKQLP